MNIRETIGYIKKSRWIFIFWAIFILGILLRVVGFGELLVFKSDQARDALIMSKAQEGGLASLSLLGPQVGGTGLRLGPVSYYFQYISGKIFGFTAESFAYPDLFFGILTIPLSFLIFRKFFSPTSSLWLMALTSFSLFLVTFSRFGWNPNSLPFFTASFAFTFLSALDSAGKRRLGFLALAAASLGIIAQLHLMAVLGLVLGLVVFIILFRVLKWKEFLLCLVIVGVFHSPMIVSEWESEGKNIQEFTRAISKRGSKDAGHAFYEKTFRAYQESARITWIVVTGQQNTDVILTKGFSAKCDKKCKASLPYSFGAMIIFGYMITAAYSTWKKEIDLDKKRAIAFVGLWFGGFLMFSLPLAYQLETRFYLGAIIPLLIFLGFAVKRVSNINNSRVRKLLVGGGILLVFLNLYSSVRYIYELNISQTSVVETHRDLRFGTAPKVTLGQLRMIGREALSYFSNNAPVIVTGESLYVKSMYYVISAEENYSGCYLRGENEVSSEFNHLTIEYVPSEKTQISFGTLAAKFTPATAIGSGSVLPKKCLNY